MGLILYKGLIYVPNNEELKRKVTQQFHDNLMGHPGQWKTIELLSREYWWPGITEFVKAYIRGWPSAKPQRYDHQPKYQSNPMRFPKEYGKQLPWISLWTSQSPKDTIVS